MKLRTIVPLVAAAVILPVSAFSAYSFQGNSQENLTAQSNLDFRQGVRGNRQFAHRHGGGRERGMAWLEQLDLSDEQKAEIKAIHEEAKADTEDLRGEMKEAKEEMKNLFANDASENQLRAQHRVVQSLHQELGTKRFETMLDVRRVLTPEQRARMVELRQQRRENSGDRQRRRGVQ